MSTVLEETVPTGRYIAHGMYCRVETHYRSGESRIFLAGDKGFLITGREKINDEWKVTYTIPKKGVQEAVLVPCP